MSWLVSAALIWGLGVQPTNGSEDYGWFLSTLGGLFSGAAVVFAAYCAIRGFTEIGVLK